MCGHSSSIHSQQQLKINLVSFSGWMDKQTVVSPYHAWNTTQQKDTLSYTQQLGWIWKTLCWGKEASPKGYVPWFRLYDILKITQL